MVLLVSPILRRSSLPGHTGKAINKRFEVYLARNWVGCFDSKVGMSVALRFRKYIDYIPDPFSAVKCKDFCWLDPRSWGYIKS